MIHRCKGRKLGRTAAHRKAMLANQAIALFRHGRIKTTHPKCKELRGVVEKLITIAKRGKDKDVHARREIAKVIHDRHIVKKIVETIAPQFEDRPGGYTQIFQIGPRANDGANMSYIQLVGYDPDNDE